jgi:DHA1 family tetracycline resistance protein-like MFS transporter
MAETSVFKNSRFLFILFTAFLSVLGIGLIIPVIPFIVGQYFRPEQTNEIAFAVGFLISLYSLCQFFAAPVLGALSDRYGRRPVLLFCLFGSAIGYILFGIGGSLWVLYIGRIIDGLTGGDISTIFAYIADITEPKDRGKYFGIIGATVGFGFILGPTFGGLLSHFGLSAPLFAAAGLTLINMLFGYFVLPESLKKEHRMSDFSLHHLNPFSQLQYVLKNSLLKFLLFIGFFYFLPFAQLQGISSVFLKDVIHWGPSEIGILFLVLGVGDMFTQGFLAGKLIPKFGELKLVMGGFFLTALAYAITGFLPIFPTSMLVYIYTIIYALGSGLFEPSMGGLVSHAAEPQEQGIVQGASQSMQSITRIVGPLLAAFLYQFNHSLPFIISVILSGLGMLLLLQHKNQISKHLKLRRA